MGDDLHDISHHAEHLLLPHPVTGEPIREASVVTAEGDRVYWCGYVEVTVTAR